jgi:hypothetical protein
LIKCRSPKVIYGSELLFERKSESFVLGKKGSFSELTKRICYRLVLAYNRLPSKYQPCLSPLSIKNFVEQWKALMEKKKADIGTPPKLTKDKQVYKWLKQIGQFLNTYIGVRNAPFTYLTRPDVLAPAVHGLRVPDQPYSKEYVSIEQEMQFRVGHDHTLGRSGNATLFQFIEKSVQGHIVAETIAPFKRTQNGRGALLAIKDLF